MLLDVSFGFFFFVGSIDLLIMTIQDLRERSIDDRYNWIMLGMVIAIFFVSGRSLYYMGAILLLALLFPLATRKFFAKGDISVLNWILIGMGLLGPTFLYLFFIFFMFTLCTHTFLRVLYKIEGSLPGLPILSGAFWGVAAIYYLSPYFHL
ncbi:MAG: hypothetical protein ACOC80_09860 [Petrotogales bacterium]